MNVKICWFILWLFLRPSLPELLGDVQSADNQLETITDSSPCSATCGLGLKTQNLCMVKNTTTALDENTPGTGPELTLRCRRRIVTCTSSWQCGLRTLTVIEGQRLRLDCMEEVMKEVGRYSWRVSWRYARGIITSNNALFIRWKSAQLDHILFESVEEKNAGTYRCDVQDRDSRRVKRIYWGVRVVPPCFLSQDMDTCGKGKDQRKRDDLLWLIVVMPTLAVAVSLLLALFLYWCRNSLFSRCQNKTQVNEEGRTA